MTSEKTENILSDVTFLTFGKSHFPLYFLFSLEKNYRFVIKTYYWKVCIKFYHENLKISHESNFFMIVTYFMKSSKSDFVWSLYDQAKFISCSKPILLLMMFACGVDIHQLFKRGRKIGLASHEFKFFGAAPT